MGRRLSADEIRLNVVPNCFLYSAYPVKGFAQRKFDPFTGGELTLAQSNLAWGCLAQKSHTWNDLLAAEYMNLIILHNEPRIDFQTKVRNFRPPDLTSEI